MANKELDALLGQIAKNHCFVETLETQHSDGLDFHDIAVWCLKSALEAAYEEGLAAGQKKEK